MKACSVVPRHEKPREDPTDVTGTWEFVLWEREGNRSHHAEDTMRVEMTRTTFEFVPKNGDARTEYGLSLEPPAFVWTSEGRVTFVGSYRLRKDQITMIFCSGDDPSIRPTDFASKQVAYRFVLKRIKRGD